MKRDLYQHKDSNIETISKKVRDSELASHRIENIYISKQKAEQIRQKVVDEYLNGELKVSF